MTRIAGLLPSIGRRDHLADTRLSELSVSVPTLRAGPAEQAHLDACGRCRGLLVGYRRAETILSGAWTDRPITNDLPTFASAERVSRLRVVSHGRHESGARWALPGGVAAVLIAVLVGAGLLGLRGNGQPAVSGSPSATPVTPPGTGVVASVRIGQSGTFAWSPDGAYLLVVDDSGGHVYDRFGKLVSAFGQAEGWLDATHLISVDGHVSSADQSYTSASPWGGGVVAGGHGSAAIIVAIPGCTGDPLVDWYENGQYVKAGEKVTPFGWSPDGKLVLLGHMDCSNQDAEMNGWKGPVQIVDFATRRVLATVPAVRGSMAFNPSGTRLAAESDNNLEIVDIATGQVKTVPDARLLGWSDDDYVYCLTTAGSVARVGATAEIPVFKGIVVAWTIASSIDVQLVVDAYGTATRIMAADGKATVMDLASENLGPVRDLGAATSTPQPRLSALWRSPWSPDGRMIALKSSDGTSLVLISVDPALIRPSVGP
jgi:WD40 repeat protein